MSMKSETGVISVVIRDLIVSNSFNSTFLGIPSLFNAIFPQQKLSVNIYLATERMCTADAFPLKCNWCFPVLNKIFRIEIPNSN